MINPTMAYQLAQYDHQARIEAADRHRLARQAKAPGPGAEVRWFSSVVNRLRRPHTTADANPRPAPVRVRPEGRATCA